MKKSEIRSVLDGYRSLFADLKFEIIGEVIYIPNRNSGIFAKFSSEEDCIFMFDHLTSFTVIPDNVKLIKLRYGLIDGSAHTLRECGEILGVTDECVRSKLTSSFRKIRHSINLKTAINRLKLSERGQQLIESIK